MEEETIVGTEETSEPQLEEVEESVEEIRARLEKAEELAKNYKIRAEKAETRVKEAPEKSDLSAMDILAVSRAGIEPEDLNEVMEYAKFKGISIHEALKSPIIKATIADKEEMRKSAAATNTGPARRASSVVSDEQLLANARQGIMPDSDADIARLTRLRRK